MLRAIVIGAATVAMSDVFGQVLWAQQAASAPSGAGQTAAVAPPSVAPVSTLPDATTRTGGASPATSRTSADPAAPPEVTRDVEALSGLFQSGGRYRITVGDVIQLEFPYVPEFEQTVTVQPDGYISLRAVGEMQARGLTVADLKLALLHAYEPILNQPVISVVLKDFEKPYVIVAGDVTHPGKYDLRGPMTVTQAIAVAGGKTDTGKLSDVLLFRRYADDKVAVHQIDVKKMYAKRSLAEDPILRPGDTVFLPHSPWKAIERFFPASSLGLFATPIK